MPRKFAVVEIDRETFTHERVHALWMPEVTEPGFYRQVGSYNAFFHSGAKSDELHGPNWSPENLFTARHWDEYEADCDRWVKFLTKDGSESVLDDRKLPQIEHLSIWEFYEAIEYDYQTKRWWQKCEGCAGYGYTECVAYYFGRVECPNCDGAGYVLGSPRKRKRRESV